MRIRRGVVRALIGVLWAGLLVLPVGVEVRGARQVASVGESLAEIAGGSLGVGIINALVEGGDLARAALFRLVLVIAAVVAFVLVGLLDGRPGQVSEAPKKRRRCPECLRWASTDMIDCPHCGSRLGGY